MFVLLCAYLPSLADSPPNGGLIAYVMSPNICAVLGRVSRAKTVQIVPQRPVEVGQMAALVPTLVKTACDKRRGGGGAQSLTDARYQRDVVRLLVFGP